jgi:hypothetical protein
MADTDEWISVAEAAQRLGVTERTLRRLLCREEYAAQTRQETRQTRTGTRQTTLFPAALLPRLAQHFEKWENAAKHGAKNGAGIRRNALNTAGPNTALVMQTYERLLAEKEARLGELQAALDHEREQSKRLTEALAREQSLRLLPPAQEASQETLQEEAAEGKHPWWAFWQRKQK